MQTFVRERAGTALTGAGCLGGDAGPPRARVRGRDGGGAAAVAFPERGGASLGRLLLLPALS